MIKPTTILDSPRLSSRIGANIILATETFQHTGNFKFRGAWHIASSVAHQHLLTSSSGNFGQALAYACQQLEKRCTVVMPNDSAVVKIEAIKEFGGRVDLIDPQTTSRDKRVAELAKREPDTYVVSGFDDELMIAGNSTLGHELAKLAGSIDAIIAPVSGGGLTSGIVLGLRQKNVAIPVIGAEPLLAGHVTRSIRAGRRIDDNREAATIADGARRTALGNRNWAILRDGLTDVIAAPEAAIEEGVRMLFHLANLKVEPTGALAIAALLTDVKMFVSRRICCVISGGNVDAQLYARLITQ